MGAMTTNRKRTEECMNVNLTNSDSSRKRSKLSTKPAPSATSAVARLSRYPQVSAPLAREVHAPCRPTKFPLAARVSIRVGDAMGNALITKFEKAKRSTLEKCRSVVEKGKEVIVVDAESDEPCADSSVEEPHGDGDKFRVQQQSQSTLSFDSELRNAELKVASRGKLWGSETQLDVESVHAYKKLLEDVGRRNGTFQRLNFEIDLNEKRRDHFNLLRPKKELDEESEALQEPFVALSSEEEDEVERAFSANRWTILVTHEHSNIEITGEKFQCLRSTGWLNDEVINLYLALLKEREQRQSHKFLKCHFFNTFFYKRLISGPNGYDFKSVRRWTSQRKLGYSLLECDKIFVPIHQEIHWCLAVINNKDKKLQYLDSMKGEDSSVLEKLAKYFADEVKDKNGKDIGVNTWKKEFVKDLPVQKNGCDCGVFMIKYVDFYSRGLELYFDQVNMPYFRRRTAKEILRLKAE
ncbi:ubiquitin-like-specific protease ESD4 [Vigna unguiculata]|uniref:Sentrin-specific protease 1 n=1 Tax=Vigna unguiculata TaxID=3917 RepID=A0A4D6NL00_VIGUN|nr:ubiquitin-like-specific protease ESD4 [Vigna unguiculata]XP_027904706.1 ubiquitin-like-specific protease ESD4 [Vigna unguiculata]QCE13269.1 sentrin-specific protease 1 [Vigna unguiculata]